MLKLPSLQKLLQGFVDVVKRFPLEILASFIGTISCMQLIENEDELSVDRAQFLIRIVLCSILGLTLFLSGSVYGERKKLSWRQSLIIRITSVLILVAFFFLLDPIDQITNIFRYGFLFVAFHLLVSFAPYIRSQNIAAFWEYNKRLFLRILTAGLYSSVLFAGLCIAVVTTDVLFNLNLDSKIYGHLMAFIFGIFNTAFFLAGVPSNWTELEDQQSYPKGLKIFTQFVLIPLATIYLCILLTYEGKVIVEWTLPKGVVSSLVLGYAVYGILSILLVHPIRHDEGNKWIKTFSRLFYFLLIPLIVLLGVAIWARISQYGVTESRYIVIVLSLWLTGITIFFLITQSENIKVIPVSLCLLTLLCIWGPQSASAISFKSQIGRLLSFFEQHHALQNGKLIPLDDSRKSNEGWEITTFIVERYGPKSLQNYLSVNVDSLTATADTVKSQYMRETQRLGAVRDYLKVRYEYAYNDREWFDYRMSPDSVPIAGYNFMKSVYYNRYDTLHRWDSNVQTFSFTEDPTILFEMKGIVTFVLDNDNREEEPNVLLSVENKERSAKLILTYVSFSKTDSTGINLEDLQGYLLLRKSQ